VNTYYAISTQHSKEGNMGKFSWILDTGAMNHVASSMSLFFTHHKIKPIRVKLPNNNYVIAEIVGTVLLTKQIILYNVLYIPVFTLNIIFVQRLISTLHCQLVFSHKVCQILEKNTCKMIGQVDV